eukprot:11994090-Heterocapsa_arctica.AAC.1
MGWMKDEQGQHYTVGEAVGRPFGRAESYVGTKFRELLECEGMAAVNTFGSAGGKGTYFAEGGNISRIDYIVIPQALLGSVE